MIGHRQDGAAWRATLVLTLAWLLAVISLYLAFLGLDVYWNLVRWLPRFDGLTGLLLAWMGMSLAGIWRLARTPQPIGVQIVSGIFCLGLLIAAAIALPAEGITTGLFTREIPSPTWYRASRLFLMGLPTVFWVLSFVSLRFGRLD